MSETEDSQVGVYGLTADYLTEPIGIDDPAPSLAWKIASSGSGVVQAAYRIRAASRPELLEQDRPDLWDTGRVASRRQVDVTYAGEPVGARDTVCWQARIWTADGTPSPWSPVARWEMGLPDPGDWAAKWIADPESAQASAAKPMPIFAREFTVAENRRISRAGCTSPVLASTKRG